MLPEILLEYSGRSGDFGWFLEMERTQGRWKGGLDCWWRQYWWLDQKCVFPHGFFLSTLIETNEREWKIIGNKAPEVESYSSRCCDRKPGKATRGRKGLLWFAAGQSSPSRWRSLGSGEAGGQSQDTCSLEVERDACCCPGHQSSKQCCSYLAWVFLPQSTQSR